MVIRSAKAEGGGAFWPLFTMETIQVVDSEILSQMDEQEAREAVDDIKKGINTQKVPSQVFGMVYEDSPDWLSIKEGGHRGRVYEVLPRT